MIKIQNKHFGLSHDVIWFASGEFDPGCREALITYFRQHNLVLPQECVVRSEPFNTLVFDLSQDRDVLYKKVAKNCRYEIKRASREGIAVTRYEGWSDEVALFLERHAAFHEQKHYGEAVTKSQLNGHKWSLYKAEQAGVWLSYLLLTCDEERIRMWVFINNLEFDNRAIVGFASRKIIWHSICDAQDMGLRLYDFGGIVLDEQDSRYGVTKFKRFFGGNLVTEQNSLVITNPLIRAAYRLACKITGKCSVIKT